MPRAADGTPMHSLSRAKHHDARMAESKAKPAMDKPAEKPMDGAEKESSDQDIKEVVSQHGPAHEVHMEHDHEAKHSHVTSHHGEHKHEKHFDGEDHMEQAHDHAHEAAGGENDEEESPDEEMGEEMAPEMEESEAHSRIPGLG